MRIHAPLCRPLPFLIPMVLLFTTACLQDDDTTTEPQRARDGDIQEAESIPLEELGESQLMLAQSLKRSPDLAASFTSRMVLEWWSL